MKQTINTIFSNLKPFLIYIVSVLIGFGITFANEVVGYYIFFIVYLALGILIGICTDFKKDKYGLIAYAVMLAVAPLINLLIKDQVTDTFGIDNVVYGIGNLSNMFYSYFTPFITINSFILDYIYGLAAPFIPIAIGIGFKKVIKSKKAM